MINYFILKGKFANLDSLEIVKLFNLIFNYRQLYFIINEIQ